MADDEFSNMDRAKVRSMATVGVSIDLIAKRMGCTRQELADRYEAELRRAAPEVMAMVGASLFAAAKSGNVTAIIFCSRHVLGGRKPRGANLLWNKSQLQIRCEMSGCGYSCPAMDAACVLKFPIPRSDAHAMKQFSIGNCRASHEFKCY